MCGIFYLYCKLQNCLSKFFVVETLRRPASLYRSLQDQYTFSIPTPLRRDNEKLFDSPTRVKQFTRLDSLYKNSPGVIQSSFLYE